MNRKRRHRETYDDNCDSLVKRKRDSLLSYNKGENGKYSKVSNFVFFLKLYKLGNSLEKLFSQNTHT